MSEPIVYLDRDLVPRSRALVPVGDAAFRHGEGVFETLRARGDRVFRLDRHLARLRGSAARIGMALAWSDDALAGAVQATLQANRLPEARLRIQVTPGEAALDGATGPPRLLVEAGPFEPVPSRLRKAGVRIQVSPHRRTSRAAAAGAKSCSYLENLLARRAAREAGCYEAILLNEAAEVCEAAMANLFSVRDGKLCTPPISTGALEGITRATVLELAEDRWVLEEPFGLDALQASDEVFLTSTAIEVLPVVEVGDATIGSGSPGPVTRDLAGRYARRIDDELGPPRR